MRPLICFFLPSGVPIHVANDNKRQLDLSVAIRAWQPEKWEIIIPFKDPPKGG